MYERVSKAIALPESGYGAGANDIEAVAQKFFHLMSRGFFLPNSPTLMNAGRPQGMLSACFVLGIDDSIEGIFETIKRTALVQKAGGGTGFAFDVLRPTGDYVSSTGGQTSGPISFWRIFAETTNAIQQGAHRRGANMGMMSVEHPDILSFIFAKKNLAEFANFNISVKITDAFMAALQSSPDEPHVVRNPRNGRQYLIPRSVEIDRYALADLLPIDETSGESFSVRDVWDMIVANAHASGEPGVCFIDRVNRGNPTPRLGRIEATNPCGEEPMLNEEACCLGSIDVSKFTLPDASDLNWNELGETVGWGVRFLDNVIDANHYPDPQVEQATLGNRKIGLGLMGLADALIQLGLRYDSGEAVNFAGKLSRFIQQTSHSASQDLAEDRGRFPNWEGSVWDTEHHRTMRNASCTTIAPTGSLSIIARCSAGIEPLFSLAYLRRALDGEEFIQVHPLLDRIGRSEGWLTREVREALLEGVPARRIQAIPARLADTLVTAHEIDPAWHVRMQAAFQENVDSAISKTVNLRADATVEDVDRVFRLAFEIGCKGTTVYRDGSRQGQTISAIQRGRDSAHTPIGTPRPRCRVTAGETYKFRMGCGTLFVTVNSDENGLCEVFANLGKAGGCPSQSEATCRAISTALRSGVEPKELIEQLRGIRCLSTATARKKGDGIDVLSCPDAIARAIEEGIGTNSTDGVNIGNICSDCGLRMRKEAGCFVCICGFSKCG